MRSISRVAARWQPAHAETGPYRAASVFADTWLAARGGPGALRMRQRRRLQELVDHARRHSPFFADLYRDVPVGAVDLRTLPPVTKPMLMERFDQWVCDPRITRAAVEALIRDPSNVGRRYLGRYLVWTTTGTTGVPAILVQDRRALTVYTTVSIVRGYLTSSTRIRILRDLARVARRGGRVATVLVTGGHYGGAVMVARTHRRHPRLADRNRLLSVLRPLTELVDELNAFRPAVLHGYPSVLALLAAEQEARRLRIDPAVMGATGETLTPHARAQIESAFGCRIRDTYGSSEAGGIAFECDWRRLHVNTDWVVVEPVDRAYDAVAPGTPSHTILVTNLANRVQPIIRYDLGDSVTWLRERCRCGSPLPTITVSGRSDETLVLAGRSGDVSILPLAVTTVAEAVPGVRRIQLVQTGRRALGVRLETTSAADPDDVYDALRRRLAAYFANQGVTGVRLTRSGEAPAADASGKYRAVWAQR